MMSILVALYECGFFINIKFCLKCINIWPILEFDMVGVLVCLSLNLCEKTIYLIRDFIFEYF